MTNLSVQGRIEAGKIELFGPVFLETDNPVDKRRKNPRKTCKRLVINRVAVLVSTLWSFDQGPSDKILISTTRANFLPKGMPMNEFSERFPLIRRARPDDVSAILEMIHELAVFEHLSDQVIATTEDYERSLFGENPAAEALVAEGESGLLGYAIFFSTFSTFIGRAGIWLEDLYVRPDFRGLKLGKGLLKAVGEIAVERNAGRYEWSVLDWNRNAIDLYERVGGEILQEWRIVRLDQDGIRSLVEK